MSDDNTLFSRKLVRIPTRILVHRCMQREPARAKHGVCRQFMAFRIAAKSRLSFNSAPKSKKCPCRLRYDEDIYRLEHNLIVAQVPGTGSDPADGAKDKSHRAKQSRERAGVAPGDRLRLSERAPDVSEPRLCAAIDPLEDATCQSGSGAGE